MSDNMMIERVARAMAKADHEDPDAPAWIRYPGPEPFGICWRDQYADMARAAIEAMRDPTETMIASAAHSDSIRGAWIDMISAALADPIEPREENA